MHAQYFNKVNHICCIRKKFHVNLYFWHHNDIYTFFESFCSSSCRVCLFKFNYSYLAYAFSIKVRMMLLNMIFDKVINLSSFSIKKANIGKILNLMSGDINQLEYFFTFVF